MIPRIQETFQSLNFSAQPAMRIQHNVNKVAPLTVQMVQGTRREKGLTCRTLSRAAAIQGVRQCLEEGNRRYRYPVCGSPDGNPFYTTKRSPRSWKPDSGQGNHQLQPSFVWKIIWETTVQCALKNLILWHKSEMCSLFGTCYVYMYVCNMY